MRMKRLADDMRYAIVDDRQHELTKRTYKPAIEDLMLHTVNRLEGLASELERDEDDGPQTGDYFTDFMKDRP